MGLEIFGRFLAKVEHVGDCWLWTGALNSKGYPSFGFKGRSVSGHRLILGMGIDIPEGHQVHHRCENKRCVNPLHLEALASTDHAHEHHPVGARCGVCGSQRKQKRDGRWMCPPCHRKENMAWRLKQSSAAGTQPSTVPEPASWCTEPPSPPTSNHPHTAATLG